MEFEALFALVGRGGGEGGGVVDQGAGAVDVEADFGEGDAGGGGGGAVRRGLWWWWGGVGGSAGEEGEAPGVCVGRGRGAAVSLGGALRIGGRRGCGFVDDDVGLLVHEAAGGEGLNVVV